MRSGRSKAVTLGGDGGPRSRPSVTDADCDVTDVGSGLLLLGATATPPALGCRGRALGGAKTGPMLGVWLDVETCSGSGLGPVRHRIWRGAPGLARRFGRGPPKAVRGLAGYQRSRRRHD